MSFATPEEGPCDCPSLTAPLPQSLEDAALQGHVSKVAEWLMDERHDINAQNVDMDTMLHLACRNGREEVVRELLCDPRLHLNLLNDHGCTALSMAVRWGHLECVRLITDTFHRCRYNLLIRDSDGNTAIAITAKQEQWEIFDFLLSKYGVVNMDRNLATAIKNNDLPLIERSLATQESKIASAVSGLVMAANLEHWDALRLILARYRSTIGATRLGHHDQRIFSAALRAASDRKKWSVVEDLARAIYSFRENFAPSVKDALREVLWKAVEASHIQTAEILFKKFDVDPTANVSSRKTTPLQEAHARGLVHFINIFHKNKPLESRFAENADIVRTLKLYRERVNAVFKAAEQGHYRTELGGAMGVRDLLTKGSEVSTSLPGTVRGPAGASLLHIAASASSADGTPLWSLKAVEDLVNVHGAYVNAIDCTGRTPLHYLAGSASSSSFKGWEEQSPFDKWAALATILLKLGADPNQADHRGHSSRDVAAERGNHLLAALFQENRWYRPRQKTRETADDFQELLNAASLGNVKEITELLVKGISVEPCNGYSSPLNVALASGQMETVLLLLACGAPLTSHSVDGLTVLQAAHRTPDLPAFYPALMREEYIRHLQDELSRVIGDSAECRELRYGLAHLKNAVEEVGCTASWPTNLKTRWGNSWNLVMEVSRLGLPVTCQFLTDAGARTHRLPTDASHPLLEAAACSQLYTVKVLCRDYHVLPYGIAGFPEGKHKQLLDDLVSYLREQDKAVLGAHKELKSSIPDEDAAEAYTWYKKLQNGHQTSTSASFLRLVGKFGLVHLLHHATQQTNVGLEDVLDAASGSEMLHIAARNGRTALVEYLAVIKNVRTNKALHKACGFTASHLAALMGHTTCLRYLEEFPGGRSESLVSLKPSDLWNGFQKNVEVLKLDVLSEIEENIILNECSVEAVSEILINAKTRQMNIFSPDSLRKAALKYKVDFERQENQIINRTVAKEMRRLCDLIGKHDPRYKGSLVQVGSVAEDIRMFLPDEMDFNLELSSFSCLPGGGVTINTVRTDLGHGGWKISLECDREQEMFRGQNFILFFKEATRKALETFQFESPCLTIVYPGLETTKVGLALYVAWCSPDSRTLLLSVDLVPAIRAPWPEDNGLGHLPVNIREEVCGMNVSLTCCGQNTWRYSLSAVESRIISGLCDYNRRVVIMACKLICTLIKHDWWYPDRYKRHYQVWNRVYLKLDSPVSYIIKTLFTKEISSSQNWGEENFLEHVKSIFTMMISVNNPEITRVQSFLLPKYESNRFGCGAPAVKKFLTEIQNS